MLLKPLPTVSAVKKNATSFKSRLALEGTLEQMSVMQCLALCGVLHDWFVVTRQETEAILLNQKTERADTASRMHFQCVSLQSCLI